MHYIEAKSILSSHNGMNLYRGCTHGCIYCDSRSECYGIKHAFEDVGIKRNAPALLEAALRLKRKKCVIATGSMSDPYLPLEKTEQITRTCLEIIDRYGFGFSCLTKSVLILRDLELLTRINFKAKCVAQMTLTTHDEQLCSILEPNAPTTAARLKALKELNKAGIPTIVWLTPILPFINDSTSNIMGILEYCIEAKVRGILTFGLGMTLRRGSREYFYKKLDEFFPGMKARYIQTFGTSYALRSTACNKLNAQAEEFCIKNRLLCETKAVFSYLSELPSACSQLSLFD